MLDQRGSIHWPYVAARGKSKTGCQWPFEVAGVIITSDISLNFSWDFFFRQFIIIFGRNHAVKYNNCNMNFPVL
jgi:hypothetical protein